MSYDDFMVRGIGGEVKGVGRYNFWNREKGTGNREQGTPLRRGFGGQAGNSRGKMIVNHGESW